LYGDCQPFLPQHVHVSALTLDVQVGDFAAVAKAAGQGPCVLVGHSWGGMLAGTSTRPES